MDRTDTSLIAIRRILRATEIYGRSLAKAAGVTAAQIRVLQILAENEHATVTDISTRMGVSQATISAMIDRLAKKNLVERKASVKDRRVTNIFITEPGRDTIKKAPDPLQQRYVTKFEALEAWEQAMIVAALERVAGMLGDDASDLAPILHFGDFSETSHIE